MRFRGLDLNLLVVLDCLLEEGSVSRAAERLRVTQPAVSASLKRLRAYFGDELIVPDGKRMVPTSRASSLRGEVRRLLDQVDGILVAGDVFDPLTAHQTFRVAASDYAISVSFSLMLETFGIEAPHTAVEFYAPSDESYARFEQGKIDLLVGPEQLVLPDHPVEFLYDEQQVVVGWSGNPVFGQKLRLEQFMDADHVAVQIGANSRNSVAEAFLRKSSITRNIALTAHSFSLIPPLLINTQRLAVVHERLAMWYAQYYPIAFAPLPFDFPQSKMVVQTHRSRRVDDRLTWFVSRLKNAVDKFSENRDAGPGCRAQQNQASAI